MFLPTKFLGEGLREFLDLHYKAHPDSDHMAKFHDDRPTDLGDLMAK